MTALDDPIWHALTTEHRTLARSYGEAHRYPADIASFVAAHSFDDLRRLAAMAGERLRMTGATEISAVCTHPDFQGRGFGRTVMEAMIAHVQDGGGQPFLHVKNENGAKRLYERLGFRVRREMRLTVFTAQAASGG